MVIDGHKMFPVTSCSLGGQRHLYHKRTDRSKHSKRTHHSKSNQSNRISSNRSRLASAHSEMNALKHVPYHKLAKKRYCEKLTMVAVRFDPRQMAIGNFVLVESKPCRDCLYGCANLGIDKLKYSSASSVTSSSTSTGAVLVSGSVKNLIASNNFCLSQAARIQIRK